MINIVYEKNFLLRIHFSAVYICLSKVFESCNSSRKEISSWISQVLGASILLDTPILNYSCFRKKSTSNLTFFSSEISLLHNAFQNGIFQPIFYSRTIFLVLVKKGKKAHLELLLVMWHGCQIILAHKDVVLAIKDEAFASLLQQQQRLWDAHCPKKFLKMQIFQC